MNLIEEFINKNLFHLLFIGLILCVFFAGLLLGLTLEKNKKNTF